MLGETLSDPDHVEAGGSIRGMGLLPMDTVFADGKTRTRVNGTFCEVGGVLDCLTGTKLSGYEIHMGVSTLKDGVASMTQIEDFVKKDGTKADGAQHGNVYGTYVHGVFDKEDVAKAVIRGIGRMKGIDTENITGVDFQAFKETQYDILAAELRKHLDMDKIYEILNAGL